MVSQAILGAIVGGSAAILASIVGGYFNQQNTKQMIKSQESRKRVDYLLEKEAEMLFELLERTHHADTIIRETDIGRMRPSGEEVAEQFRPVIDMFETARPFVSEEVTESSHELASIYTDFQNDVKNENWDWEEFDYDRYSQVHKDLLRGIQKDITRPIDDFEGG